MSDNQVPLEILIQIRDEIAGLNRARAGLQGATKDANTLGSVLKQGLGIGTGMQIAVGAVALLKSTLQATVGAAFRLSEEIQDQSQALGMSARAYQVYRLELAAAGVDAGRLNMAVTSQTQTMAEARDMASSAATAYRILGLDLGKLEQMPADRRLEMVARATLGAKDQTLAFQAAGQILGARGLPQLLNALRNVARDGYDKVASSAEAAGRVMDAQTARSLDQAKKQWEAWKNFGVIQSANLINAFLHPLDNMPGSIVASRAADQAAEDAAANQRKTITQLPLAQTTAWRQAELGLMVLQGREEFNETDTLTHEIFLRKNLSVILRDQLKIKTEMLALASQPINNAAENQFDRDKLKIGLENEIAVLKKRLELNNRSQNQRVQLSRKQFEDINDPNANPDFLTNAQGVKVAMQDFMTSLGSEGQQTAAILQSSLGSALNSIGDSIWNGFKGVTSWADAFRNLGDIAGRMLSQIIAQMVVMKALNMALGLFGFGISGDTGPKITRVAAAGGADFITSGPTQLTVGDNPGGRELVSVIPISGIGQTMVNGNRVAMAGGGTLLAAGQGGGDTFNFSYSFHGGVSRQEVLGLIPSIVEASKGAVLEAKRRGRSGF